MATKVGVAGLGTVGAGVCKILERKKTLLKKRCGKEIEVVAVSSRNRERNRGLDISSMRWYDNALDIANDSEIDIVVECIGGNSGIALELCVMALENKKHVVTANKALIATHGNRLAKLAEEKGVALLFEAAVAGGIPILKNLRENLAANEFLRVSGILNGTCNYILTEMQNGSKQFDDVLSDAQEKGYAETPPDLDVDGIDAAHKLAIITSVAYGCNLDFDAVYTEGIREISLSDIKYANEFGYNIRLLGVSRKTDNGIEQKVHPALVPHGSELSSVDGVLNAVLVECDSLGAAFFTGAGAGEGATASSVVADIMDIAAGRTSYPFGMPVSELSTLTSVGMNEHTGGYYIRIKVKDESGVLSSVTSLLSAENIGVESVLQKANEKTNTAQLAIITHETCEKDIINAIFSISEMEYVLEPPHMIRIERF